MSAMKRLPAPLDEIEWRPDRPNLIDELGMGPTLHTDNILWYLMNSNYFDHASNNASCMNMIGGMNIPQSEKDAIFRSRAKFEELMNKQFPTGVQFVVVSEPKKEGEPWVMARENRQFVPDGEGGRKIQTTVEATYYTVPGGIRMAPRLVDVVHQKLLATFHNLSSALETTQALAHWSPSTGSTYMPPSLQTQTTTTTKPKSQSRAGSVVNGPTIPTEDLTKAAPSPSHDTTDDNYLTTFSDPLFRSSLHLASEYGHEYMDENPLTGEPGSFVFASTNEQVEARNKAAAEKAQKAAELHASFASVASGVSAASSQIPGTPGDVKSAVSSVAPTPKFGPGALDAASRKGSTVGVPPKGKVKRRKSKGGSPMTPKPGTPGFPSAA